MRASGTAHSPHDGWRRPMIIGVCTIELSLPGNGSLKGKRNILKSLIARLRHDFNISVAEVGDNDLWQSAVLGVVCVSSGAGYAHGLLTRVMTWLENSHYDIEIVDYEISLL
jgi:uncharacterized protein YlxP (DUF503 family)